MLKHQQFLQYVAAYVQDNPEVAAFIQQSVAEGIERSRQQLLERAADMEVLVTVLCHARYGGRDELVLSKLKKWDGKTSCNFSHLIEKLEKTDKEKP